MDSNLNNNGPDFKFPDDAFEYLVNQRLDEKRRKEWAKALGPPQDKISKQNRKLMPTKKLYIRLASIAASAILIGGFFLFSQKAKPLDQYAGNLLQETEISMSYGSAIRGENPNVTDKEIRSLKSELTTVLLDQDFNQALGYFKQLEKMSSLTIEDKYFFAISLLKTKGEDYQKAIRLLNDVVNANDHNQENALWLKALAYGMTENAALMKKDLSKLNSISKKTDERVKDLLSKY